MKKKRQRSFRSDKLHWWGFTLTLYIQIIKYRSKPMQQLQLLYSDERMKLYDDKMKIAWQLSEIILNFKSSIRLNLLFVKVFTLWTRVFCFFSKLTHGFNNITRKKFIVCAPDNVEAFLNLNSLVTDPYFSAMSNYLLNSIIHWNTQIRELHWLNSFQKLKAAV